MLSDLKIVVEEHPTIGVPHELLHGFAASRGSSMPACRVCGTPKDRRHLFQICFCFVQQAIEADRREVMGLGTIRTEAEGNIEARLAHAAVTFVVVGSKGKTRY